MHVIAHSSTRRGKKEESEAFPTAGLLPCVVHHQQITIDLTTNHIPILA